MNLKRIAGNDALHPNRPIVLGTAIIRIEGCFVVHSVDECSCLIEVNFTHLFKRTNMVCTCIYLSRFIEEWLCFMYNSDKAVVKKLSEQPPFVLRLASFIVNNFLIIIYSGWRTLLLTTRSTRSIPIGPIEIRRKNFILTLRRVSKWLWRRTFWRRIHYRVKLSIDTSIIIRCELRSEKGISIWILYHLVLYHSFHCV